MSVAPLWCRGGRMASIQRLDSSNLSSADAVLENIGGVPHRNFGAILDKSHSFRNSHVGRATGAGGSSSSYAEASVLTSVLFLESISLPNAKLNAQVELRRAMNAVSGHQSNDPSLGSLQSKPLESCSGEEVKRMRTGLLEGVSRAKERVRHLSEAVIKLDRFLYAMQSRKRIRPESVSHDRNSLGGGQRGASSGHLTKASSRCASSSGEGSGMQKGGGYKSKSGMINKRMRTSLADARPEGRPSNLSVQRSSGVQKREREGPRLSSFTTTHTDENDRVAVGGGGGYEKTKMKGRRSATIKAEAVMVGSASGGTDGDREHKGSALHHRGAIDGRSRPSEGHGYRSVPSGPVHGTLSVQRAEAVVHTGNGGSIRGGNKVEVDGSSQGVGKVDRSILSERDRVNVKIGVKLGSRDEVRVAGPGVMPKAKRSNLVAGSNQAGHLGRSSSFIDIREKASVMISPTKVPVPSGALNRKGSAPSRSSSPRVASWGSSRPQKMARARRVNLNPPLSISVLEKEEADGGVNGGHGLRDASVAGAALSARAMPSGTVGGFAKRSSCGQSSGSCKAQSERVSVAVVSVECVDEVAKSKERSRKREVEEGERKKNGGREKSGSVLATIKKEMTFAEEEGGGADGVRRQGRTGRVSVTPLLVAASPSFEKVEVSRVNEKSTRSGRAAVEMKLGGVGRPGSKKGSADRKTSARPRRLLGNVGSEMTEDDDDHEQLSRAVQQAVEFSASACSIAFWRLVEPYFSCVTSDDLSFLRRRMAVLGESNAMSQSQSLDGAVKSAVFSDRPLGGEDAKDLNQSKEQSWKDRNFRRGSSGEWYDKVFPLSQRLLSAFISERQDDGSENVYEDVCVDQNSDCRLPPSTHTEMDMDVDNAKPLSEWWSTGARQEGYSEGLPMSGGQGCRAWDEDQDGEDIVVVNDGDESACSDWGNAAEVVGRGDDAGCGRVIENWSMEWEEQYGRMSLDDRLAVELSSIGLLCVHVDEHEDDDIGEELRRLEIQLSEQVSSNTEHLCRLESAVLKNRAVEERAREKLAMDRLVELACKKKSGGRSSKVAAAKVARAAALAFAKRVLIRVQNFEAGNSCVIDPGLRERLFCVAPSPVDVNVDVTMDPIKAGGAGTASSEGMTSLGAVESGRGSYDGQSAAVDCGHLKDGDWMSRAREREAFLEDVSGYTSTRDVNSLCSNGFGGIKGKRSERERDGKVKDGGSRPGQRNAKGERKMKTKPRQKTGPLLKSVQGLVPKAAEQHFGKARLPNEGHSAAADSHVAKDEVMSSLPAFQEAAMEADSQIDLSAIPLPVMEEMNMAQADMGSWLDFDLEDPLQQTHDFLMGLDVPMDDLSGLHMMM